MARRPNILLITTDQERSWLDLPGELQLEAHARLLEHGTGFANYNVNTTPCGPMRSVMYTGQHTQFTRITANPNVPPHRELPRDMPTLGTLLREQGYYTAYKGKWHLSRLNLGADLEQRRFPTWKNALEPWGFSDYSYDGEQEGRAWTGFRQDPGIANDAANWLLGRSGGRPEDQPWLLAVNFVNPHDIMFFDATGHMAESRLDPLGISPSLPAPTCPPFDKSWQHVELPQSFHTDDLTTKPWAHQADVDWSEWFFGTLPRDDEASWRAHQGYYFNCLRHVDEQVGVVLRALDASGLADGMIVIYTSDHGELAGAHGMRQKGPSIYKENVRVPLIVRHPDARGGDTTDALACGLDLVPTVLSLAGAEDTEERHPELEGRDLSAAVGNPSARTPRDETGILFDYGVVHSWDPEFVVALFSTQMGKATEAHTERFKQGVSLDNHALFRGIHTGRHKFARYFKPSEHHQPKDWETLVAHNQLELYDLASDPDEVVNLAAEPATQRELLLELNARTNALIEREVGEDLGAEYGARDPDRFILS